MFGLKQSEMQCIEMRKAELHPDMIQCKGRKNHRKVLGYRGFPVLCQTHWNLYFISTIMES